MGLDFDPLEYCKNLKFKQSCPPFHCPVDKCLRNYKSLCGLQYHLLNYHEHSLTITQSSSKKKGRSRLISTHEKKNCSGDLGKESISFFEVNNSVQYDIDGKSVKLSISENLPIVSEQQYADLLEEKNFVSIGCTLIETTNMRLPEAVFKEIGNYNLCNAPFRQNAYIRFIEKSVEELDGEIEYDVDEEDTTWLAIINEKRQEQLMNPVNIDTLELLIDRLEKESFFQAIANGQSGTEVDDDAVCCICMDGECQNTNVILFCDMCNLAVHQDCYGVPYIPEGQWLCRRCLQSPSTPVHCVLCPNNGGAFKQTDLGLWAHVVCALWIPEVRFANTVFLEPIDSIETIPAARWRLTCYICKEKNVGACIQCQRNNCYAAFHVTCAQQAGLHMHMETVKDQINELMPITVQKTAFCHVHTPVNAKTDKGTGKFDPRHKMKEARKVLAKKRSCVPTILIPTIPPDRLQEISSLVSIRKKTQFIQKLIAYWTLKRQYRNGVPLLRRLQSQGHNHTGFGRNGNEGAQNTSELYQQLKYWQCLRQDLERARLLCELIRKREKLKAAYTKISEQAFLLQFYPLEAAMNKLLNLLVARDTTKIFHAPVDITAVPDYLEVVVHPMDLSTMRSKLNTSKYKTIDDMENDFNLMIRNCLAYNNKDTIFYRSGVKMRDQGAALFKMIREELKLAEIFELSKPDNYIVDEIETDFKRILNENDANDECVLKLSKLIDRLEVVKSSAKREKKIKQIRGEIIKMKKLKRTSSIESIKSKKGNKVYDRSEDSGQQIQGGTETPPCSPQNDIKTSASPSGVNRRTAVLFTRKAQAALKRPENTVRDELKCKNTILSPENMRSPKRTGKRKRSAEHLLSSVEQDNEGVKQAIFKSRVTSIPDSFRFYRANVNKEISETDESDLEDNVSESQCSSCSGFGISGSGSEFCSSSEDEEDCDNMKNTFESSESTDCNAYSGDESLENRNENSTDAATNVNLKKMLNEKEHQKEFERMSKHLYDTSNIDTSLLRPLQLVWAKCRGYPWYPALIIDPQTPKGYVYNGVPLPAPPVEVLNLRKNYMEEVFLVLFFDVKRTWQWLPPKKLEFLGLDKEIDQNKLIESRKPTDRKAVKRAYQDALLYQSQVTDLDGQGPDPIM